MPCFTAAGNGPIAIAARTRSTHRATRLSSTSSTLRFSRCLDRRCCQDACLPSRSRSLTAGAIGLTVRRRTGGIFLPVIAGLAYLASPFVYHVGPLCRQHLTMVFLEVLCVYFIAASTEGKDATRNLVLGLFFLFLAGYAKQLAVFTAVAVFGYLFARQPIRAVKSALGFGLVFGVVFALINWATHGHWWTNTIAANVNEFILPQLVGLFRTWLRVHPLFIILAIALIVYELYRDRVSLYALWFLATLGTGIMSAKWGAGGALWVSSVAAAGHPRRVCAWQGGIVDQGPSASLEGRRSSPGSALAPWSDDAYAALAH